MADQEGAKEQRGGTDKKRAHVATRAAKIQGKAKRARTLTPDEISVVGIQLNVPGRGTINIGAGGAGFGTSWDMDLSDAKVDRDPTDEWFDMDGGDFVNDMDPTDDLVGGGTIGPIA